MKKIKTKQNNKELQKRNSIQAAILTTFTTPAIWWLGLNCSSTIMPSIAAVLMTAVTFGLWTLVILNK